MAKPLPIRSADLRGAARLATEATAGLTDLVEAMHERIGRLPGVPATGPAGRTRGLTGLVYKTVRGVTRVVGGSVDGLLGAAAGLLASPDPSVPEAGREAVVAALNGVLGDHLAATGNPLATPMALRHQGRALTLTPQGLAQALPDASDAIVVLIHGLCMNDLQWARNGHDHGAALARDLGFSPVYLHYNTGRPVAQNGQELAEQLQALVDAWPRPVTRLVLLGHSMGGLVARCAMQRAAQQRLGWLKRTSDAVFLGTPHHGAPLERAGRWVDVVLGATPYAAPLARLGRLRSAGINDLRHGLWGDDASVGDAAARRHVPLPAGVRCHAVATRLGPDAALKGRMLGDGLVSVDSALGRHADSGRDLGFAPSRQWVVDGIGHLDQLGHPEVYKTLHDWLAPRRARPAAGG